MRAAAAVARAASAADEAAANGFVRLRPRTAIGRSSKPASGTSSASARSPPTKTTWLPSDRSSSATASAGTTCPAVPPAAITTLRSIAARSWHGPDDAVASRGDVEQQAHRGEQGQQRRRARRDERQRHAGQGREAEHGEDVERRLAEDERGQAG